MPKKTEEMNLVTTWRSLKPKDKTFGQAVKELKRRTGVTFYASRMIEWEKGERMPSQVAVNALMAEVIPQLLSNTGMSDAEIEQFVMKIRVPIKKKGAEEGAKGNDHESDQKQTT